MEMKKYLRKYIFLFFYNKSYKLYILYILYILVYLREYNNKNDTRIGKEIKNKF